MKVVAVAVAMALTVSSAIAAEGEPKSFGKGLGNAEPVKIAELTAHPGNYVGKTVRVEGVVVDVCTKAGCWMDLATDEKGDKIRIKVDDGVMVFPVEAKGSHAVAEGVFTKIEMTAEQAKASAKHEAAERGEKFDPATVAKTATVTYRIAGTGAVIN